MVEFIHGSWFCNVHFFIVFMVVEMVMGRSCGLKIVAKFNCMQPNLKGNYLYFLGSHTRNLGILEIYTCKAKRGEKKG